MSLLDKYKFRPKDTSNFFQNRKYNEDLIGSRYDNEKHMNMVLKSRRLLDCDLLFGYYIAIGRRTYENSVIQYTYHFSIGDTGQLYIQDVQTIMLKREEFDI